MWTGILGMILTIFFSGITFSQTNDIVNISKITDTLHQLYAGRIIFMQELIPAGEFSEQDFLKDYKFDGKNNLYAKIFMDNSLTNYLHKLDPSLNADDLTKKGNFQFSFYVDGNLIYKENLHPGAFGTENKNTKTSFSIPLQNENELDSWGWFMWNRFMMNGGEDALTAGNHFLKIEIRPYLKDPELRTGELIAAGEININVVKPQIEQSKINIQEINPGSGWQISGDNYNKDIIRDLNTKIAENYFKKITSIVIVKNGKLLLEEYFNGGERESLNDTRSVGKSFVSAMMGIAIEEGYIKSVDQKLSTFYNIKNFENYSPGKENVTIKSLLTMCSGFEANDNDESSIGNEENMYDKPDWIKWVLNLPMSENKPGEKWSYFTGGAVLLGDIINKSVPDGFEMYAAKKIFYPLGIHKYKWMYTPQNIPSTAGGLELRAIDFAKFGQLYKNDGRWHGKQILPSEWINESFHPYQQTDYGDKYGYLFWNKIYKVDGKEYEAFYCGGNGGNKIFIFKNVPLVIVITATAYNKPYMHTQVDKMMEKYILKAVAD